MRQRRSSEDSTQRRIQSIEVGFRVIRAMEAAKGPLPLRDIAAAAGMPPSKAHLYLVSFVAEGVSYQDPVTGHYGLGRFAIQLGLAAIRQLDVVEFAREELTSLERVTGFAAHLSVWGDRGPGIVSKVDGRRQGSLAVRLGYVLPLLTSASGQVFLAHLDRQDVRTRLLEEEEAPFEATETAAPRRPEDLEALVRSVRERGYATTAGNLNASFAAVSAPVFDYSGRIVAAMTVLGSERLMAGSLRDVAITALLEGAARLSERLGFDTRKIPASESAEAPVRNRRKRPAASAGG